MSLVLPFLLLQMSLKSCILLPILFCLKNYCLVNQFLSPLFVSSWLINSLIIILSFALGFLFTLVHLNIFYHICFSQIHFSQIRFSQICFSHLFFLSHKDFCQFTYFLSSLFLSLSFSYLLCFFVAFCAVQNQVSQL